MGNLPMFKDELPLVEQVMVNYGNTIEPSPIVHPEIAGRGVEYAHGRAAWKYSSQCQGVLADMKMLVLRAYNKTTQPQTLMSKYERRTRDYIRSYRMGTSSKDLEKMRAEIKTHRNMLDYHTNCVRSERADDATDTTLLGYDAILKILPQNKSSRSLTVPVFPADTESCYPVLVGPHDDHACDPVTRSVCPYTKYVGRSDKVVKGLIIQRANRMRVARMHRFEGPILLLL
jgi:hypothetical protein